MCKVTVSGDGESYNGGPRVVDPTMEAEPDGMLAYALAMEKPDRSDPNWPLPSFDARDWAEAFCKTADKSGHPGIDEEWMVTWFANALMRGYDEANRRAGLDKAQDVAA